MCEEKEIDPQDHDICEAIAWLRRGELAEGLLWLGRGVPELQIAHDLYVAERIEIESLRAAAKMRRAA